MEYNFKEIEPKWQRRWQENKTYKVETDPSRPKFYVLDMFPYPSGAGLHVGHPLGYIASDIYSRYKRQKGFNVLHPMGYDAFGLPAEQYAIQTGQHPAVTTERNIARYREQLDKIGFSFDWDREVRTCDPAYYKWTQWAFLKMFGSYYCYDKQQARPIEELTAAFEQGGTQGLNVACSQELHFTAEEWRAMPEEEKERIQQESPLETGFQPEIILNGRKLRGVEGNGLCWLPESCREMDAGALNDGPAEEYPELDNDGDPVEDPAAEEYPAADPYEEERRLLEHYGLDPAKAWSMNRWSFSWATKRPPKLRSLSLTMKRDRVCIPGIRFTVRGPGDQIPFIHPSTGERHVLTVLEYQEEEMDRKAFEAPEDMEQEEKKENLTNTFDALLEMGVIPIVNENDSVSYKEIESEDRLFGDNDMLSSVVSVLCRAKRLVIFSDIDGFYDSDPRLHPNAKLIKEIRQIDESVYSLAGGAGSRRGTGGMRTKLQAAELAASQGIDTIVTNGKHPEALYDIVNGKQAGTLFVGNKDCL